MSRSDLKLEAGDGAVVKASGENVVVKSVKDGVVTAESLDRFTAASLRFTEDELRPTIDKGGSKTIVLDDGDFERDMRRADYWTTKKTVLPGENDTC